MDMIKKIDEQLDMAFKGAWLEKKEKKSHELIETIDFSACKIETQKLKMKNIIAQGAYGSVYQGIYHGKKVAVKVFHMGEESKKFELRRSFAQEVLLSNDLDHPNIAKFIGAMKNMAEVNIKVKKSQDLDKSVDSCIVYEFLPRGTLYQYLQKHQVKKIPITMAIQLALDIAKGLSYLHSKQIMHRDVKTDNMVLDKNGRVKIIDFGVSRIEDLTQKTQCTGTLGYMAPEVLAGSSYDHKCDVFGFGICLWEIVSSSPYHFGAICDTVRDNPYLYNKLRPEIHKSCPSALADLMKHCWDSDPKKRPEMTSVVEMLKEFEASTLKQGAKEASFLSCFSR